VKPKPTHADRAGATYLALQRLARAPGLEQQDGNELWPAHVRATVGDLARRLGHGV